MGETVESFDRKAFLLYREQAIIKHKIRYIFWECTLRCNMACRHCGSECLMKTGVPDMPYVDFLRAIDEIIFDLDANYTTIAIIGGEPLLRDDIEDLGYELQKRGLHYGIVTNAFLLTRDRINSLWESGLRSLSISLDGLEKNHNWLRNHPQSFEKAINAIGQVVQRCDIHFDVITCVNKRNLSELRDIRSMLISHGVRAWRLFTIFPRGRAVYDSDLILENHQVRELFEFIIESKQHGQIQTDYGCEGYAGKYERQIRDYSFFCVSGIQVVSVLADGSITGCPSSRNDFIQGSIYKDNLRDCWNQRFIKHRDRSWMKNGKCENCDDYILCNGGSLHLRDATNQLFYCHHMLESE